MTQWTGKKMVSLMFCSKILQFLYSFLSNMQYLLLREKVFSELEISELVKKTSNLAKMSISNIFNNQVDSNDW